MDGPSQFFGYVKHNVDATFNPDLLIGPVHAVRARELEYMLMLSQKKPLHRDLAQILHKLSRCNKMVVNSNFFDQSKTMQEGGYLAQTIKMQ